MYMYICLSIRSSFFIQYKKKKDELKKEEEEEEGKFCFYEDDKRQRQRQRQGLLLLKEYFLYICSSFSIFTLHTSASTVEPSHCISPCLFCMYERYRVLMDHQDLDRIAMNRLRVTLSKWSMPVTIVNVRYPNRWLHSS